MGSGYALVDEFCRAGALQTHFFRRCQREFRDEVLPTLEIVDACGGPDAVRALAAENAELKATVAKLSKAAKRSTEAA